MKQRSLRVKFLFSIGVTIFFVLGSSTLIHIRDLQEDSINSINLRSEALAQGIVEDILNRILGFSLADLSEQAQDSLDLLLSASLIRSLRIYELNKDKGISFIGIINSKGTIVAHTERELWNTSLKDSNIYPSLQSEEQVTVLDEEFYHTLIPIITQAGMHLGFVDIGTPHSTTAAKVQKLIRQSLLLFICFLFIAFVAVSIFVHLVLMKPIRRLIAFGEELARGNLIQVPLRDQSHELATLSQSFNSISEYMQNIAAVSSQLATGVIADDVQVRSRHDVLGQAIHDMLHYLKTVAGVAGEVAEGKLTNTIRIRSEEDAFSRVLHAMTEGLRSLVTQLKESAHRIADTGNSIASYARQDIDIVEHVRQSAEEMSLTMHEMGKSIEEVAQNVDILSSSTEETSASVAQMASSITHIAGKAKSLTEQTDRTLDFLKETVDVLKGVVSSTDESKQLSHDTIEVARIGQESVEQVIRSVETIEVTMAGAVESINRFAQRSEDIDTILDVIRNITEQTSLLALNASIIAAQAGTHGRGFAVVADEIKSLALGVGASTKDIAEIVQSLQHETKEVTHSIHKGADNVKQGIERTHQARESLQQILSSAERSSLLVGNIADSLHGVMTNTRQVSAAMDEVDTMTDDITLATNEQEASTKQIDQAIALINDMSSQIQHAFGEQLEGVQRLLDSTEKVVELIERNQQSSQRISLTTEELAIQSNLLLRSVDRFKLAE